MIAVGDAPRAAATTADPRPASPPSVLAVGEFPHAMLAPVADGLGSADHPLGAGPSSDLLRQRARCSKCGHKGATLQIPSWAGSEVGLAAFPAERLR